LVFSFKLAEYSEKIDILHLGKYQLPQTKMFPLLLDIVKIRAFSIALEAAPKQVRRKVNRLSFIYLSTEGLSLLLLAKLII